MRLGARRLDDAVRRCGSARGGSAMRLGARRPTFMPDTTARGAIEPGCLLPVQIPPPMVLGASGSEA
jgi:hypothetical protein